MKPPVPNYRAPPFTPAQVADLAKALAVVATPPPIECRLHPDDWEAVRRMLPATPKGLASVSLRADIGSTMERFTEIRIVIDVDAPRLPLIRGALAEPSIGGST